MVKERLLDWAGLHSGVLPASVLFYRDGVSESQYEAVREHEIALVKEGFDLAAGKLKMATPQFKLTFVIVGKRHNTRFYPIPPTKERPQFDGSQNGNVLPGCVVDQGITHPYGFDFYLQSHQPIKGTGRSAHYFVLQNEMKLGSNQLQRIVSTHVDFRKE